MARGAVRLPPQPSDTMTADMVVEAVNWALREFGVHSRADRMAQEFGDHSDAALPRRAGGSLGTADFLLCQGASRLTSQA